MRGWGADLKNASLVMRHQQHKYLVSQAQLRTNPTGTDTRYQCCVADGDPPKTHLPSNLSLSARPSI
jgi:hypothetical protein